jgi:hypothetical protein
VLYTLILLVAVLSTAKKKVWRNKRAHLQRTPLRQQYRHHTIRQMASGALPSSQITKKEIILMDQTACSVKGVLDTVRMQIKMLNQEIKSDNKSKMEYERQLERLEVRKADLQRNIEANSQWIERFAGIYT